MSNLDYTVAVREIGEAVQYLRDSGSPKVGITGGCVGGAVAFAAALGVPALACAAPFYGTPDLREFRVDRIKIPVQYHTGKLDNIRGFSDVPTALWVQKQMVAAGCNFELHLYDDTPHSFLNALEGVPGGIEHLEKFDYGVPPPEQVALAFERLVAFLDKHLK